MNQPILEKYLWGDAIALRGNIVAGDLKQYIFPINSRITNCIHSISEYGICRYKALCFSIRKGKIGKEK